MISVSFLITGLMLFPEKSNLNFVWLLILLPVIIAVSSFFSHLISRNITNPLRGLIDLAGKLEKGSLEIRATDPSPDEIGELTKAFNQMAKKIEGYYREMDSKVKTQQKYLLNILNDTLDGIISLDANDRIMTWNRGAELIYGYKASEIVGKHLDILIPANLKKEGELEKIRQIIKDKGFLRHYETQRITKEGKRIIVDITRTVIKNDEGVIVGFSAIVKDITERKDFERRLMQTEKLTTMGQIAANIAHEIKNPLMGISGSVQVLMKRFKSYPTVWDTLSKIFEQVQRLDSTLKGLLSFARPQTPHFSKGHVNEILDQVLFFISQQAKIKNIGIIKEFSDDIPSISLDPDQIKQVFFNIILNAIQAMPEGGQLKISTFSSNGSGKNSVRVTVTDTGPGISNDLKDEIFKPFFTTKSKGTGLGLVISRNIVKVHRGSIDFNSETDKGSTFEIKLPVEQ